MKEFKIRCSAIGQIMTQPRSKAAKEAGELGDTAKSYCKSWLMEQLYNRHHDINSKYFDKGIAVEQDSIDFAATQLNWGLVFKNEEYKENEYMTGTCDVKLPNRIIDMKNAFSWEQFPYFEDNPKDKGNEWQLRGYMKLFNKTESQIVYTLMDTPESIIEDEIRRASYNYPDGEIPEEMVDRIIQNHTYPDLDPKLRIKEFDVIFHDDKKIEQIYEQVRKCRVYIKSLLDKYQLKD